jgi:hypothetical protein
MSTELAISCKCGTIDANGGTNGGTPQVLGEKERQALYLA